MLPRLETYFGSLQTVLQNVKEFVRQNQFELLLLAGVIALILFAGWLNGVWKRLQTRRELRNSEVIAYHLDRIANSLERLGRSQRTPIEVNRSVAAPEMERAEPEAPRQAGVGSMFGFSRGLTLPNPMYRPK